MILDKSERFSKIFTGQYTRKDYAQLGSLKMKAYGTREQIMRLWKTGRWKQNHIAKEVGVSRQRVHQIVKNYSSPWSKEYRRKKGVKKRYDKRVKRKKFYLTANIANQRSWDQIQMNKELKLIEGIGTNKCLGCGEVEDELHVCTNL